MTRDDLDLLYADWQMVSAAEIRWTPDPDPANWLDSADPERGLAGIVVALLQCVRAKNELIIVALGRLHDLTVERDKIRAQHHRLIDEYRKVAA